MAEYKTFSTTIKLCVCFLPELQKYLSGSLRPCSAPFPLCPISCLPPSLPSFGHGLTSPSQDPRPTSPSDFEVHWLHSYDGKLLVSCYLPPPPSTPLPGKMQNVKTGVWKNRMQKSGSVSIKLIKVKKRKCSWQYHTAAPLSPNTGARNLEYYMSCLGKTPSSCLISKIKESCQNVILLFCPPCKGSPGRGPTILYIQATDAGGCLLCFVS